jgi:hypothetical protein
MDDGPRWSENFPGFAWFVNLPGRFVEYHKKDNFIFFSIIFDDVVEYLSIRCTQLKKQGRRTKPILTVG